MRTRCLRSEVVPQRRSGSVPDAHQGMLLDDLCIKGDKMRPSKTYGVAGAILLVVSVLSIGADAMEHPFWFPVEQVVWETLGDVQEGDAVTAVARPAIRDCLYPTAPVYITQRDHEFQLIRAADDIRNEQVIFSSPKLDPEMLAVSWDGLCVVIGLEEENETKLYLLAGDSGDPIPVTTERGGESAPTLSSDKSTLAFLSDEGGEGSKLKTVQITSVPSLENSPFPLFVWEQADEIACGVPASVLPGSSEERTPCYGPGGLAFVSNVLGSWDVWLEPSTNRESLQRVVVNVDPETPLAWVGDRLFIVLDGVPGLVSVDGRTFQPVESTEHPDWLDGLPPGFVVSGGLLLGAVFPEQLVPEFAFFRSDGSGSNELGELWLGMSDGDSWKVADRVCVGEAAWSPDGQHLAYLRRLPRTAPLPSPEAGYRPDWFELWVADRSGGKASLIHQFDPITRPWQPGELQWDLQGDRVFFSVAGSPTHREIWSLRVDGSDLRYHTWGWDFRMMANGRIAGITRGLLLFQFDPETGDKIFFDGFDGATSIECSPCGRFLVAMRDGDLFLLDWDAGGVRELGISLPYTYYRGPTFSVDWAPSGDGFAVAVEEASGRSIDIYNTRGERTRRLVVAHTGSTSPSYSSDGEEMAYVLSCGDEHEMWCCPLNAVEGNARIITDPLCDVPLLWRPTTAMP